MNLTDEKIINKWKALRARAENKNIPFNLNLVSVKNLLRAKHCAYTGKTLKVLSIDRIDPAKGYVKGNVCACEESFNHFKRDVTPAQVRVLYKRMFKKPKEKTNG